MDDKILNVEPFQETLHESLCGPASLKIVLKYYGMDISERDLARMCGWNSDTGTDGKGIKKAAEELGYKVIIKNNSEFSDIQNWLAREVPVIINWFTRGRNDYDDGEIADGHYSVVIGLDQEYIFIQDSEIGRIRKIKRDDFIRVWFDFKGRYIKPEELIIRQIIAIHR